MTYETILFRTDERLLTITLDRPDSMNAFTTTMCEELIDAFNRANLDDDIDAVIVTGSGKAFCAGMDLKQYGDSFGLDRSIDMKGPNAVRNRDLGGLLALAIFDCRKPVIAAINGAAVGIGATMTLPMDFRIASENARIGFVFSRIGIMPEAASNWFLPRLVGISKALEWAYSGEVFAAREGQEAGLIHSITNAEDLIPAARRLAKKCTEASAPVARAAIRQTMWRMLGAVHPMASHNIETRAIAHMSGGDGIEGVRGFLEKRPAQFAGKPSGDMPPGFPWLDEPEFDPLSYSESQAGDEGFD